MKRGHQVEVEEIPNDEDDTSFQLSQKTNRKPPVAHDETQSTVAEPLDSGAKTEKVPHEWLKLFRAEWTLRGIKEAKTESEARAILKIGSIRHESRRWLMKCSRVYERPHASMH